MKQISMLFAAMALSATLFAQAPQKMNYQGVARDNGGNVLANQNISLRLSILSGSISGTTEYSETQAVATNDFGLFNVALGGGSVLSGTFNSVDWGSADHFIKVELDASGGTSYSLMGTSQLLSVPYALYAESSGSLGTGTVSQTLRHNGVQWVANNRLKSDGSNVWVTDNSGTAFATFNGANKELEVSSNGLNAGRFSSNNSSVNTEILLVDYVGTSAVNATAIKATSNPVAGSGYGVSAIGGNIGLLGQGFGGSANTSVKGVEGYASGTASSRFGGYFTGENSGGTSAYGVYGKGTGSSTVNFGVYGTATGGSANWAGYFFQGDVYINNKLGIGDITPTYPLSINSSTLRTIDINQSDALENHSYGVYVTMNKTATVWRDVHGGRFVTQRTGGQGYVRGVSGNASNYGTVSNIQYAIGIDGYGFQDINGTSLYGVYGVLGQAQGNTNNKYGGFFIGDVYGSQFLTPSDKKLKTNLGEYQGALSKIAMLKPMVYTFDIQTYPYFNFPEGEQIGFLAEDLQSQFPHLVKPTSQPDIIIPEADAKAMGANYTLTDSGLAKIADGIEFDAVNYTGLIPVLVTGMQEQQKLIEALQKQIDELLKQIAK